MRKLNGAKGLRQGEGTRASMAEAAKEGTYPSRNPF
jgi:hypothetical protein